MDPRHAWYSHPPMPPYPAAPPSQPTHIPLCPPPEIPYQHHFHYQPPPPPPPPLPQHPPPPPPHDPYPPFPPLPPPPPQPWNPIANPNFNNNSNNNNYVHAGAKRVRVDESVDTHGSGHANVFSIDDERILNLIREHGGSSRLSNVRNGFQLSPCSFDKGNFRDFEYSNFDRRESLYEQDDSSNISKQYRMINDSNGYSDSINRFGLGINFKCDYSFGMQHGMESKTGHHGEGGINRLYNQSSQVFHGQQFSAPPSPPLPPPRAVEPSRSRLTESMVSTSLPDPNLFSSTYLPGVETIHHTLRKTYPSEIEQLPPQYATSDDQKIVDASLLLKHPHRTTRPDHIVVILRGLPGSGKSYLAKMFRDLEVENGCRAPRIHTMDDYFMMEVEKIEESEASKSSSSVKGRKPATKIVMEYCYEPEMEEAYRSSMLKAFKKTLDEGVYSFVIGMPSKSLI